MCWAAQPCPAKALCFLAVVSHLMDMCPLSRGCGACVLVPEVLVTTLLPNLRKVPLNLCFSMSNLGIL